MISGFTFCHDALRGGYPVAEAIAAVRGAVDEVVAVDIASTDGTRDLLLKHADRVLDSPWLLSGGKAMNLAFTMHVECQFDTILLFEADEVFDPALARAVRALVLAGHKDLRVWRVQVSQNGQRMPWAPHPVHRLFQKGHGSYLANPVFGPETIPVVDARHGYVWDVTKWFRDCYWERRRAHGEAWGHQENIMCREHFLMPTKLSDAELDALLAEPHWTYMTSPFALPDLVKGLLGKTRYEPGGEG